MVRLQRSIKDSRLFLLDPERQARVVWSLESGLIETYERAGSALLQGHSARMGLQFFVTLDGVPALRGRHFSNNSFLPAALPESAEVTPTSARVSVLYRAVVPMLPEAPAVTLRVVYNYTIDAGLRVSLEVVADGYRTGWQNELQLGIVAAAPDDVMITVLDQPDDVHVKSLSEEGQQLQVFTRSVRSGTASLCVHIGADAQAVDDHEACTFDDGLDRYPGVLRDFARLLLTTHDGFGRLITGFNIVEPQGYHYLGIDRDDVVAEMTAIACRYYRRFEDRRFLEYAERLAEPLMNHLQPDGGLTFGFQVNAVNVDYSDTDADAIDAFIQLFELTEESRYLDCARRLLHFLTRYQDDAGFFWGRIERNDGRLRFGQQPWFTAYATVAMQQMLAYVEDTADVEGRIERALKWLVNQQRSDGSWPHDTEGSYADYDDLTNTSVAVWCLAAIDRLRGTFTHSDAVLSGLEYLTTLERPDAPGQYAGHFTPNVEVLIYDYKLGFALRECVHYLRRMHGRHDEGAKELENRYLRYLRHLASIQGKKGMIQGAWGSVYDIQTQRYLVSYRWHERHSSWQQYAFLGWQGKLIELFLEPFLSVD